MAHEYNHILQFGYDTFQDLWMFESTATWAEQKVYPSLNDYLNYLPVVARYPHLPMTGRDKIYGESVWNHFLEARYGPDVVRDAWAESDEAKPAHFAVAAYERSIKQHGGSRFSPDFARLRDGDRRVEVEPAVPGLVALPGREAQAQARVERPEAHPGQHLLRAWARSRRRARPR